MKFVLTVNITNTMTGIDLDDEYERLGFERRPNKFPPKCLTYEVTKDFVRENLDIFGKGTRATIKVKSSKTNADDWEDWGSAGNMLSQEKFTLERAMSLKENGL